MSFENYKAEVCKRLKDIREDVDRPDRKSKNGLSYKYPIRELADCFTQILKKTYDYSRVSRLEKNHAMPTLADLYVYNKHFNIDYDVILLGKNSTINCSDLCDCYGLEDKSLIILNRCQNDPRAKELNFTLNTLIQSGLFIDFLLALHAYIYTNLEDKILKNSENADIKIKIQQGKNTIDELLVSEKNMKNIDLISLIEKIEKIKNTINAKASSKTKIRNKKLMNLMKHSIKKKSKCLK